MKKTKYDSDKNSNKNTFGRKLQKYDLFGQPVSTVFNLGKSDSNEQKTNIGAITSIFLRVLLLAFVIYKMILLFGSSRDFTKVDELPTDQYIKSSSINMKSVGVQFFAQVLQKQENGQVSAVDIDNKNIKKFLTVNFVQKTLDHNGISTKRVIKDFDASVCEVGHFQRDLNDESDPGYKLYQGQIRNNGYFICAKDSFGGVDLSTHDVLELQIRACQNDENDNNVECSKPNELRDFFKNILIQTYVSYPKHDSPGEMTIKQLGTNSIPVSLQELMQDFHPQSSSVLKPISRDGQIFVKPQQMTEKYRPDTFVDKNFEHPVLMATQISLDGNIEIHSWITYNFFDFISDIAGVSELLISILGIVLFPLAQQGLILRAIKLLYYARTADSKLLDSNDTHVNPKTGSTRKQVRFVFDSDDENQSDRTIKKTRELEKKKAIVINTQKKGKIYTVSVFGCCKPKSRASYIDRSNSRLLKLFDRGKNKLQEDFDLVKIHKTLHDLRVMFKFYRLKNSDLMIQVNKSRHTTLNLEDDGWESEFDRQIPYLTRFENSYESQSSDKMDDDDIDISEESSISSKKSLPKDYNPKHIVAKSTTSVKSNTEKSEDQSGTSKRSATEKEDSSESSSESDDDDNNTINEQQQVVVKAEVKPLDEMEDFDSDINETVDQDSKPQVKMNKPGPASFHAKDKEQVEQANKLFLESSKNYLAALKNGNNTPSKKSESKNGSIQKTPKSPQDEQDKQVQSKQSDTSSDITENLVITGPKTHSSSKKNGGHNKNQLSQQELVNRNVAPLDQQAYRFSFDQRQSLQQRDTFGQQPNQNNLNEEPDPYEPKWEDEQRGSIGLDLLSKIQKTKDYLAPTVNSAYGIDKQKQGPNEDKDEYDIMSYKNREQSARNLSDQMAMRPTVSPKELQEVQKYSTIQRMIKQRKGKQ